METIDIVNNLGKMFIVNVYVYFTFIKIINYKGNNSLKNIIIFCSSIILSELYMILDKYMDKILVIPLIYFLFSAVIKLLVDEKFNYCVFVVIISFILTYMVYLISVLISGLIMLPFMSNISYKSPISLLTIPIIMALIYFFIFKIKRIKNGFNFLNNKENIKNVGKFVNITYLITIIVFELLEDSKNTVLNYLLAWSTISITIGCIIWVKSQITKSYKTKMRDRTIEIQKAEIDEKGKVIEEIKNENLKLATAIHKYNHKFEALELAMKNAINLESKTEFAEELSIILKDAKETSKNFAEATEVNIAKLPETKIPGIDNMFKYMQEEARKNNINFDLKINASINSLIDNIIPKEKFEILIGDHLKDAIIAVNSSEKTYKSILVILGLVDGVYEFSVYDTGIEFEIDTLLKLGKEQVTTHKDTGGSGIGFMTTFETLKECKGSLIIEEYNPETTSYTKSVTIRFDGKNKYKICSYRAEKIKEQKTKRRIIIQKLK